MGRGKSTRVTPTPQLHSIRIHYVWSAEGEVEYLKSTLQQGTLVQRSLTPIYCFGNPPSHWHHWLSVTEVVGWLPD